MLERDEVCFDTRTVKQPFAGQLAAADGDTTLYLLVAFIELNRWVVQIIDRCEALDLTGGGIGLYDANNALVIVLEK